MSNDLSPLLASGIRQVDELVKSLDPDAKGALITSVTFNGKTLDAHLIVKKNEKWYFDFGLSQPVKKQLPTLTFNTIYVIK